MKYELQVYEPNLHGHRENLTKNRTYHPMRWKGIAQSDDIEMLRTACLRPKECRIVDNDTLEIFSCAP